MIAERCLRLTAGLLILLGLVLGRWLNPWGYLVAAVIGADLVLTAFVNRYPLLRFIEWLGVGAGPTAGGRSEVLPFDADDYYATD
jgi:hypothetical protein